MEIFFIYLSLAIASFCGALFGNYLWAKRKWRVTVDEENSEIVLESDKENNDPVVFIHEPDAEDEIEALEEVNDPAFHKFLKKFKLKKKDE